MNADTDGIMKRFYRHINIRIRQEIFNGKRKKAQQTRKTSERKKT